MSYASFREAPASPPPPPRPVSRFARHRLGIAAGVAAVLVIGAAGVYSTTRADAPEPTNAANAVENPETSPAGSAGSSASVGPSASASASTTPSASAKPSASAAPKVPATGWVPVDRAAWKAQVDAYRALKTDPVPAGVGNLPEFRADCQYSHRLPDDPIVAPGLPGASHMHSFVGNRAVDADTVAGDLTKFTATSCKPVQDHSAYWVPTLYDNGTGKPVETSGFRVYYRSLAKTSTGQMPMPNGLRMISGDAKKKKPTPRGATGQFYCAFYGPGDLDGIARSTNGNWPICGGDATLHYMMQFPDCWDGKHLDSPNHKDHVAYGTGGGCPSSHPVRVPAITFDIQYPVKGTPAGYYLSSDKEGKSASSMHGDAFVMWDVTTMNKRTKNCVLQRRTCDNYGYQK
ncbi:DUF1996 domain-containing protein [Micromonospora sp. WMMD1120]|uniref:DUF1996 domain-containing protein n=1 Tax=Micromonospora sp. WMMD1120 TaxID=3016106 RepID=UPI0024165CD5|nr:DUF1996 domain-containing protein [Micromonospora sp. WMMD1120]MDG4808204.1 DUF1996 domain-containing protein [Micromonospora sp. WMMD1120]